MMNDYYQRSMRALQLAGLSESTQESYTRSVRQLIDFCGKTPDQISEKEMEDYFLHRKNIDKWSAATIRISHFGIKFFFKNILKRKWHIFTYLNAKRERRLPCILSKEEVFRILDHVTTFHNYTFLSTVYSCGPRLSEALSLQVSDIDSQSMMIHIHRGKGAKDRYVPLPHNTLKLLRRYWITHKIRILYFRPEAEATTIALTQKIQINEIFRSFGPEYIQKFGDAIPAEHRKVLDDIIDCRTESFGIDDSSRFRLKDNTAPRFFILSGRSHKTQAALDNCAQNYKSREF